MAWPRDAGKVGAQARRRCPHCEKSIRPCNLARHIAAKHPADAQDERGSDAAK